MKRLLAVALLCAIALTLFATTASADKWVTVADPVKWFTSKAAVATKLNSTCTGCVDSTAYYAQGGAVTVAYRDTSYAIPLPEGLAATGDTLACLAISFSASSSYAAGESLYVVPQYTWDGKNWLPELTGNMAASADQVVMVAAATGAIRYSGGADAGTGTTGVHWCAGFPQLNGARAIRLIAVGDVSSAITGNPTIRARVFARVRD